MAKRRARRARTVRREPAHLSGAIEEVPERGRDAVRAVARCTEAAFVALALLPGGEDEARSLAGWLDIWEDAPGGPAATLTPWAAVRLGVAIGEAEAVRYESSSREETRTVAAKSVDADGWVTYELREEAEKVNLTEARIETVQGWVASAEPPRSHRPPKVGGYAADAGFVPLPDPDPKPRPAGGPDPDPAPSAEVIRILDRVVDVLRGKPKRKARAKAPRSKAPASGRGAVAPRGLAGGLGRLG